jgi:arginine decarboxylase
VPQPVRDLFDSLRSVNERRLVECYHDALQAREQALQMFNLGYLSLEFRGLRNASTGQPAPRSATSAASSTNSRGAGKPRGHAERHLFLQFLVFQSLPDSWAIGQLFPIMPIHRLGERRRATPCSPTSPAIRTARSTASSSRAKPSAPWRCTNSSPARTYYLAAFLVGAYQETLGDLHNLFGDTHVVHIRLHDEGGWWIEEIVKGDTANKVLEYMEYDTDELYPRSTRDCERAVREGG